ncbi:MAG: hypothetical protein E4H01_11920 [Lysobacterales bacterium]|nr:MAG: hypothetical protein E4H01_11920 [Xanthomonadales bacterium]
METQVLANCRCGSAPPHPTEYESWFLECIYCWRCVGALSRADAAEMWNAAMTPNAGCIPVGDAQDSTPGEFDALVEAAKT